MSTLTVDLQDGFKGDEVVILVDGREKVRRDAVRTLEMIALAESAELPVDGPRVEVEIRLPGRGLSGRLSVDPVSSPYLGCSVKGGSLELKSQDRPFRYM